MLNIVIAESALERVPKTIWRHPSVIARAKSLGKEPSELLLDRSYHHSAMNTLPKAEKRGRPDIVHMCLLNALETPLNREGGLRVYVHTWDDMLITISPIVRLPRNYNRFVGLIEQLYQKGAVPSKGETLLKIRVETLQGLLRHLESSVVITLSVLGQTSTVEKVVKPLKHLHNPTLMIGGFPRGHFSEDTILLSDRVQAIDPEGFDAWIVVSRLIYEFEKQSGFPSKRWERWGKR
jgi:rRNA small subunit pseudouridine methyltransferase Nep1